MAFLDNPGFCPTCNSETRFVAETAVLRSSYKCTSCGSVPRERALIKTLETFYPAWAALRLHESSPAARGASLRFRKESADYIASQFFPGVEPGSLVNGVRCENLEALTFSDNEIDLHVSQDVMEHVFDPMRAFAEIARTLKPGGAHVFTVPLVNRHKPSSRRARLREDGEIEHLKPPVYHGNPISSEGSLVTVDWGFDICRYIHRASGLFTFIQSIDDLSFGIRAEINEVLVTVKPATTPPAFPV